MNNYLILAGILFGYFNLWYLVSRTIKRNDVADFAWGPGFVLLAWSSLAVGGYGHPKAWLVNILVTIWGLRLAGHIYSRIKNKPEDYRYLQWRQEWGKWFIIRSYLQVFMLQGLFMYIIAWPVMYINLNTSALGYSYIPGIAVWIIGFAFEAIGDKQLAEFVRNPANRGKLIQTGLWRYSRHPNYFGEVTQWWGIFLLALTVSGGWITVFGPMTISGLILFVSGVPLLENKYRGRKDWEEYKRKTSVFLPWPPRQ